MDLNIALLIQIGNFLIAYLIVRTLLLKPAVAVILQEEAHRAQLDNLIASNTQANKAKEENMVKRWTAAKETFAEHAPEVIEQELALRMPSEPALPMIPEIDTKSLAPMADRVADELVERISHVR